MTKKSYPSLVFLLALPLTFAGSAMASNSLDPETAWRLVAEKLKQNEGLVAYGIHSTYEIPGDGAPEKGEYRTTINGWSRDGQPIRTLVVEPGRSISDDQRSALDLSLASKIASRPDLLFDAPKNLAVDDVDFRGSECRRLEFDSNFHGGRLPVHVKLWFSTQRNAILRVEGRADGIPLPGVKAVNFDVEYGQDERGRSLPIRLRIQYAISILFNQGIVLFDQDFARWEQRP